MSTEQNFTITYETENGLMKGKTIFDNYKDLYNVQVAAALCQRSAGAVSI